MERTSQQRTVNAWPKFFFELEGKSSDFCNFRNRIEKNKKSPLLDVFVDDFLCGFFRLSLKLKGWIGLVASVIAVFFAGMKRELLFQMFMIYRINVFLSSIKTVL
jgi:hypothetical protein